MQFFCTIGGVKNCLREGDCVLGGQPVRIPPFPFPCPRMVITQKAFMSYSVLIEEMPQPSLSLMGT